MALKFGNSFLHVGVSFDKKLKFNSHIVLTVYMSNGILCFIKRWAREFGDLCITKHIYTTLMRWHKFIPSSEMYTY